TSLRLNPGRDVALLNALIHTVIEEGLYDRQYVQARTEDFEKLRDHIRDYSPEKMAPICGIDAATLRYVARTYARAERAIIFWGMGISQHTHGTVSNTNRQVQMGRTALPLPGNARLDWWIIQEIARRIGLDWSYTHPRDVFAEMKQAMPSLDNITWERLQTRGLGT